MYGRISQVELDELRRGMEANGISFFGGSDLECHEGKATFAAREKAIRNGFTVRREAGKVCIVINSDDVTKSSEL